MLTGAVGGSSFLSVHAYLLFLVCRLVTVSVQRGDSVGSTRANQRELLTPLFMQLQKPMWRRVSCEQQLDTAYDELKLECFRRLWNRVVAVFPRKAWDPRVVAHLGAVARSPFPQL